RPVQEPSVKPVGVNDIPPVVTFDLMPARKTTSMWHTDATFAPRPPAFTALRAVSLPPLGGDTCWACMYAAYDALSAPMQAMLDGLTTAHSAAPTLTRLGQTMAGTFEAAMQDQNEYIHPLIRVHPETGRKALFYCEAAITRIVELTPAESDHVMALL